MKFIDEAYLHRTVEGSRGASEDGINAILAKSLDLHRLSVEEACCLLSVEDRRIREKIFAAARAVKESIYGKRIVLFAPLYISNACANTCRYCAFRADNALTIRKRLGMDEIRQQTRWLLKRGHKRLLVVAGEAANGIDYYTEAIRAIYETREGPHAIKRVNINCAPLSVEDFRKLKEAGIGTYQLFQETYHEETYRAMHIQGPKSDPDNRLDAISRAFSAGIDDLGIGVLYGLYDFRFETAALLSHVAHMERTCGIGPHTISVPRIEPAAGTGFVVPHPLSDDDFKLVVAVLRLAVPYTGLILSTRETASLRDELFDLGISQASAESRTAPGGYSSPDNNADTDVQFCIGDQRSLDEVIGALVGKGYIPSFCAACYRSERTGKAFMDLAQPGTIQHMCSLNALVTLKEYLDDFATPSVREKGYQLISKVSETLDEGERQQLCKFFSAAEQGVRDQYV
jgi:2-iminoacetate synthase